MGIISIGTPFFQFFPNFPEFFLKSTIIISFFELEARIFSCTRQPPPPLIRLSSSSTSSAPSKSTSITGYCSNDTKSNPFSIIN